MAKIHDNGKKPPIKEIFKNSLYESTDCDCGAVNGSHTRACYCQKSAAESPVICWCCQGRLVSLHSFVWSGHGAQCLMCFNDCRHHPVCRKFKGALRDFPAGDASALGAMYQIAVMAGKEVASLNWSKDQANKKKIVPVESLGVLSPAKWASEVLSSAKWASVAPQDWTGLAGHYVTFERAPMSAPINVGDWITLDNQGRAKRFTQTGETLVGVATTVTEKVGEKVLIQVQTQGPLVIQAKHQHETAKKVADSGFIKPNTHPILMMPPGTMQKFIIKEQDTKITTVEAPKGGWPASWEVTWTDDDALKGSHYLVGVDTTMPASLLSFLVQAHPDKNWGDANCVRVVLQRPFLEHHHGLDPLHVPAPFTLVALEDPSDGYRSMLGELFRLPEGAIHSGWGEFTNIFPEPQPVTLEQVDTKSAFEGLIIRDYRNGQIIVEIGTDYDDDCYPKFVGLFSPQNMWVNTVGKQIDQAVHEVFEQRERQQAAGRNYRPILLED